MLRFTEYMRGSGGENRVLLRLERDDHTPIIVIAEDGFDIPPGLTMDETMSALKDLAYFYRNARMAK